MSRLNRQTRKLEMRHKMFHSDEQDCSDGYKKEPEKRSIKEEKQRDGIKKVRVSELLEMQYF